MTTESHQVLLFYKYIPVSQPEVLATHTKALAEKYSLVGRAIVSPEGINMTFEGTREDTENFVAEFIQDERFSDMQIKRSAGTGTSFPSLSVKVRLEIVGTGFSKEEADPYVRTAPRLSPDELRQWYEERRDFVVIDMRNNYEYASGHFKNSIEPGISASRHLPLAMRKLEPLKSKKVVTVCTGGVRCEKMSAYLLSKGFEDVYQLEGGIHTYMEKYPGKDFLGTLYTFDQRLTMDFGGTREIVGTCHLCGAKSEKYTDCANDTCHLHFIACEMCTDETGRAYCSDVCRVI